MLRRHIERSAVDVHTGRRPSRSTSTRRPGDGPALTADDALPAGRRGVRRRRPAARRARPRRRACPSATRGGVVVDDGCAPPTRRSTRSASVACVGRHGLRPGRRRATRWPRSPPTGCSAARRPSPAPTCRPSSSCSASTSPASATPSRRRPARSSRLHRPGGAGVYKKLVITDDARTLLGGILVGDAGRTPAARRWSAAELAATRPL